MTRINAPAETVNSLLTHAECAFVQRCSADCRADAGCGLSYTDNRRRGMRGKTDLSVLLRRRG